MSTTHQSLSSRYNGIATEKYPQSISSRSLSSRCGGINPLGKHAKEYIDEPNTNCSLMLKGYRNTICSGLGRVPLGKDFNGEMNFKQNFKEG